MTETSDDGWTDWIPHDGGPCPIQWAKAGEFQLEFIGTVVEETDHDATHYAWGRDCTFNITAYRIRSDLAHRLAPAESAGADDGWKPIERAPADTDILLGWWETSTTRRWVTEVGWSHVTRSGSHHGQATHWRPLPPPPGTPARPIAEAAEEMARALEAFAEVAESDIGEDEADGDSYRPMDAKNAWAAPLTVGDLRRARAALAAYRATQAREG